MNKIVRSNNSMTMTGYTLIEVLVVVLMAGVLAAITAPSWVGFLERQRLNSAASEVHQTLRRAQSRAEQEKVMWQASFREATVDGETVFQSAVHPFDGDTANGIPADVAWNDISDNVQVDKELNADGKCETTLNKTASNCPTGPWGVRFDYRGQPRPLGQITLTSQNVGQARRCVIVSTLLGAMRTGQEHPTPNNNDKYCY